MKYTRLRENAAQLPLLSLRPWHTQRNIVTSAPYGFLQSGEGHLLYFLARDYFSGRGIIVDAGSFLGRSAFFFTTGLQANRQLPKPPREPLVHCFDNFIVNDAHTAERIRQEFGEELEIGASTRFLFDRFTAALTPSIRVYEGDFHTCAWEPRPIEILFIDIAKAESLNRRVLECMFPHLLPGRSLIIHQDYHHPWLPFIHVTMEFLHEHFELVEPKIDDTAVFLLKTAIPPDQLSKAARLYSQLPLHGRVEFIDRAIRRLPEDSRRHVELARAYMIGQELGPQALAVELDILDTHYPDANGDTMWTVYREQLQATTSPAAFLHWARSLFETGRVTEALNSLTHIPPSPELAVEIQRLRDHCLSRLGQPIDAEQKAQPSNESRLRGTINMATYSPDSEVPLSNEQLLEWGISGTYAKAVMKASEPTLQERGQEVYDNWVEYGLTTNVRGQYWLSRLAELRDISGSRYIDVGCGFGGCCIESARRGAIATGVDVDSWFLELAKENARSLSLESVRFVQGNIEDTGFIHSLGQFDLITCFDVLEHVKDIRRCLETIFHIMTADGLALLGIPNGRALKNVLHDPHLGLFGVSLLETSMACEYVRRSGHGNYDFVGSYLTFAEYQRIFDLIGFKYQILHTSPGIDYIHNSECLQLIENLKSTSEKMVDHRAWPPLSFFRSNMNDSYHAILRSLSYLPKLFHSYVFYKEYLAMEVYKHIQRLEHEVQYGSQDDCFPIIQDYFVPYWEFIVFK